MPDAKHVDRTGTINIRQNMLIVQRLFDCVGEPSQLSTSAKGSGRFRSTFFVTSNCQATSPTMPQLWLWQAILEFIHLIDNTAEIYCSIP